ncbi:CPBP family intramembrane metalloprotease [candidate division GN15 bacterium]|nr:CPBP family intramembrane metalloprotease [candidate division GN15 bacterium]
MPFLVITFVLTWGIIALYIVLPDLMESVFGQLTGNHPLFFLAVYSPAIAAFSIILRRTGTSGLRRYLTRLLLWRCSPYWYAFLLVGLPLVFYGGAAWKGTLYSDPFPFSSVGTLSTALILSVIKGPIEEFGWRGFAQPLLQRKLAPLWVALIIGIVWGFWHLPAFLLSGTQQSAWSFSAFFIGTIAISLIMTPLYNASRGSILLAAFMHFQLMNPIWPDAQPYDTYILIVVAVIVVALNWKTMFSRVGSVTQVIPDAAGGTTIGGH